MGEDKNKVWNTGCPSLDLVEKNLNIQVIFGKNMAELESLLT